MQYLTAPELAELLSCQPNQFAVMARRLKAGGWPFEQVKGCCPKVLRAYFEERQCGAVPEPVPPEPARPMRQERHYDGSNLQRYHQGLREARQAEQARLAALPKPTRRELLEQEAAREDAIALQKAATVRFHAAKRRTLKLQRTPAWADMDAIRQVYQQAQEITQRTGVPHHVDHDIPLQGELVSGLHVHNNLQILTGSENSKKRNRFEIEP